MKILITEDRKLHLQAIGNTAQQEAATRQELAVSVEFADTSLIDADTENVLIKIKTSRGAEDLAASATIARVGETAVFSGFINLSTSILNELADGSIVLMECTWILATKVQRSDPRQLMIRQSIVTGDEGAPEADQSVADRLTWLSDYILAGDNITITEDSDLGTITISSEAGGDVAWADITGKPSTFTPATHSHTISDTTGLQAAIDGKAATSHTHIIADTTGLQAAIDGKAATSHTHAISDVTNLQSSLDGKSATGHTHISSEVGLGNVDNTSDANKPVSSAVQSALNLKLDLAGGTMTGQLITSLNGAASTPPIKLTGTWFTGGSATTTKPQLLIEPTGATSTAWSTSGTGLGVNAATGFAGNLLDLQVNGTTKASINSVGRITLSDTGGTGGFDVNSTARLDGAGGLRISSNHGILWAPLFNVTSTETTITRPSAYTILLSATTNPCKFRVSGTTTGSKYLQLEHDGTNAKITASSGSVHISNLPTSNPGPGILWNNAGSPAIGT